MRGEQLTLQAEEAPLSEPLKPRRSAWIEPTCDSLSSWSQIENWLTDCTKNHTLCKLAKSISSLMPSRLVAIQSEEPGRDPVIQLIESDNIPADAVYTTLSHCWGPDPAMVGLTTTTTNINELKKSIPWCKLSKTFRDAIMITQRLDIKYLWIDSLCIIQDSADDWLRESGRMQHVYSNSFLNIAASAAPDGRFGCIFERDMLLIKSPEVIFAWNRDGKLRAWIPALDVNADILKLQFSNEPLNQRAWVVQERILAPRVLHFSAAQLVWECREDLLFEIQPHTKGVVGGGGHKRTVLGNELKERFGTYKTENYYNAWFDAVRLYSRAAITKSSDKLVAISGVAERLKEILQDNYLWGLWEKDIMKQLIWVVVNPKETIRYQPPIAPTWSWASLSGEVVLGRDDFRFPFLGHQLFELVDASRYSVGARLSPDGLGGELRFRGYLTPVSFTQDPFVIRVGSGSKTASLPKCSVELDYMFRPQPAHCFCFPITADINWNCLGVYGLLLEELVGSTGYFRRIGVFHLEGSFKRWSRHNGLHFSTRNDRFWKSCYAYGKVREGGEIRNGIWKCVTNNKGNRLRLVRRDRVIQHTVTII
jgi:hypothetical protein